MTNTLPKIDFSRISFPSDRLTLKQIRPSYMSNGLSLDDQLVKCDLENTLKYPLEVYTIKILEEQITHERMIALEAFERVLKGHSQSRQGKEADPYQESRIERRNSLDIFYQDLGLSSGPKQSVELIRNIEAQAAAQARGQIGQSR